MCWKTLTGFEAASVDTSKLLSPCSECWVMDVSFLPGGEGEADLR